MLQISGEHLRESVSDWKAMACRMPKMTWEFIEREQTSRYWGKTNERWGKGKGRVIASSKKVLLVGKMSVHQHAKSHFQSE